MKRLIVLQEGVYNDAQNKPCHLRPGDALETGPDYGASLVRDGFAKVEEDTRAELVAALAAEAEFAVSVASMSLAPTRICSRCHREFEVNSPRSRRQVCDDCKARR